MTDASTAVGASDIAGNNAAPASPAPAQTWRPIGYVEAPPEFNTTVAAEARAKIETLKSDRDFYQKLQQQQPEAHAEWRRLHATAYPSPAQPSSPEDVKTQDAARAEEQWSGYFAALQQRFPLTAEQQAEIRRGVITPELHRYARDELDRALKDRAFRVKVLDGDRQANLQFGLLKAMLGLRPVKS